jgi:hypothetical protein
MNFIERFTQLFARPIEDKKEPFQAAYEEAYDKIIELLARLQREKAIALHEPRTTNEKHLKRIQFHLESVGGKSLGYIDLSYTPDFTHKAPLSYHSSKSIELAHGQLEQFLKEVEAKIKHHA